MDQEVQPAPGLVDLLEHPVDIAVVLDVAGQNQVRAERPGQWPDALSEGFALIGEGQLGPLGAERSGDAPGDGVVVRNSHDQTALAGH